MPDTAPDPVAALEQIRVRNERAIQARALTDATVATLPEGDVRLLAAAVERVLALHRSDSGESTYNKQCGQDGFGWPCPTVRAISAALAGKEDTDGRH